MVRRSRPRTANESLQGELHIRCKECSGPGLLDGISFKSVTYVRFLTDILHGTLLRLITDILYGTLLRQNWTTAFIKNTPKLGT